MFGFDFNTNTIPKDLIVKTINESKTIHHKLTFYNNTNVPSEDELIYFKEVHGLVKDKILTLKTINNKNRFWLDIPSYEIYYWWLKNRNSKLPFNMIFDSWYTTPDLKGENYFINEVFVKKQIQHIKNMTRLGFISNAGAFGTGSPTTELVYVGVYDELLKYLHETGNGLSMYITMPFPFETFEYINGDKIFDLKFVKGLFDSNQKWSLKHYGEYFGKINTWHNRIKELKLEVPIYITYNFGFGSLNHYSFGKRFEDEYGNWVNYFELLFGETIDVTIFNILCHLKQNVLYHDTIKAIYLKIDDINSIWLNEKLIHFRCNQIRFL